MADLKNLKRQLKSQLSKGVIEDWTTYIDEADEHFIKCLIPELYMLDNQDLVELFRQNNIYSYADLCNHYSKELGISGD